MKHVNISETKNFTKTDYTIRTTAPKAITCDHFPGRLEKLCGLSEEVQ